ncbi:uncharacterized protein LOC124113644 isoform X2 [Haliotis rufescens]|uniref:uncharacterized protein LOC124113644 isoform X2 n=1 Tax=Haliotis rufescens TaxID=6454 RepID=UPI00201F749A|nr:uncharacterized protein LOC124113644 isoform X2 [Haliotis rufescens]
MSGATQRGKKRKLEDVAETPQDQNQKRRTSMDNGHSTNDEEPIAIAGLPYTDIKYTSVSAFPPTVKERGNSLEEIFESVPSEGIFPSEMFNTFEAEEKNTNLTSRLRDFIGKAGIALVGRSMAATCNLKNTEARPDSVIYDALLISQSLPPTLLTFIEAKEDAEVDIASVSTAEGIDDEEERKYNKSVAKAMMHACYFTDEHFDVIYGIIKSEDNETTETFNRRLSNIKEETSKYSIGSNLLMSQERCLKIHKAFIMMSALSDIRLVPAVEEDVGKASHYVVPVDMYRKLMLHLDSTHHRTTVSHSDESFHLLLNERFSKTGKNMVDAMKSDQHEIKTQSHRPLQLSDGSSNKIKGECTKHKALQLLENNGVWLK